MVEAVSNILYILTLVTDVFILGWLIFITAARFIPYLHSQKTSFLFFVGPYTRIVSFIVAFVSTAGSLFYSDVAGYSPCVLCWYQRILMYPQVLLIGMTIVINDTKGLIYPKTLSFLGILLASYHYYLQIGGPTILPCSAVGYSAECSERFTTAYGYITIPMMSLSAFVAIFILLGIYQKYGKKLSNPDNYTQKT